jgi:hypothetical protein
MKDVTYAVCAIVCAAVFLVIATIAPKGRGSPSPGQRPGESGSVAMMFSAQRANSSANHWPVGPKDRQNHPCPQGVALGWENGRAFGPLSPVGHVSLALLSPATQAESSSTISKTQGKENSFLG